MKIVLIAAVCIMTFSACGKGQYSGFSGKRFWQYTDTSDPLSNTSGGGESTLVFCEDGTFIEYTTFSFSSSGTGTSGGTYAGNEKTYRGTYEASGDEDSGTIKITYSSPQSGEGELDYQKSGESYQFNSKSYYEKNYTGCNI